MGVYWLRLYYGDDEVNKWKQEVICLDEQELFDLVLSNYIKANQDYIAEQIRIASEYLTEEQKEELRKRGFTI